MVTLDERTTLQDGPLIFLIVTSATYFSNTGGATARSKVIY